MRRLLFLSLLLAGCSGGPPTADRAAATAAFGKEVEPEIVSLLGAIFDPAEKPTWTGSATLAELGKMSNDDLYLKGDRVQRQGTLSGGVAISAEGYYSYQESRIVSVTLLIDFPTSAPKDPDKPAPISAAMLKSLKIHPALTDELMKGIGQGSMNGNGKRDDQAKAKLDGKTFEVSTALVRDKPISLELSCTYER